MHKTRPMKHSILTSPSKLFVVLSICLFCFTGSTCNPTDTTEPIEPCGDQMTWGISWGSSGTSDHSPKWSFGLDGDLRTAVLYSEAIPEDMCPDEHVTVDYSASMIGPFPITIDVYGQAFWSLYGRTTILKDEQIARLAKQEIGLKQAFDGKPGYLSAQIKFVFLSQGSLEIDTAYLMKKIESAYIDVAYRKFKE
jgi:hypothetical protein